MPTAPSTTPQQIQANVTLEQEQLNNFLGPVNGALGGLPVAEKNQDYFLIYEGAGGTGPEIIDETAIFITYLVDSKGNVSKPSEDYDSLYNLIQNFEVGKNVIIRNDIASAINNQIGGKQKITGIGRQLPLLYSQTGSSAGANVDFLDFNNLTNQEGTPRMEGWLNRGIYDPTDNNFNTVTNYNNPPISSPNPIAANFDPVAGTYTVISSGVGDIQSVFFQVTVGFRIAAAAGVQNRNASIRIKRDSTVIGEKEYTIPGNNTSQAQTYNFESDPLTVGQLSPFFTSGNPVYTVEIQFDDANDCTADFINFKIINQSPQPSNPIVSPNYWENNSGNNLWITASSNLSINYGNVQNSQNVLDSIESGFNFSPVITPFTPQPGDRIRFEYNKSTDYTIYEVIEPSGAVDGLLKLRLNTLIPSEVNLNNFIIHRVDSTDPVYIIINVPKQNLVSNSNQFKGVLLPEYPTKELKNNLDNILLNLKEKGILPNEN